MSILLIMILSFSFSVHAESEYFYFQGQEIRKVSSSMCVYSQYGHAYTMEFNGDMIFSKKFRSTENCEVAAAEMKDFIEGKDYKNLEVEMKVDEDGRGRVISIRRDTEGRTHKRNKQGPLPVPTCQFVGGLNNPALKPISLSGFGCNSDTAIRFVKCDQAGFQFTTQAACVGGQTASECFSGTMAVIDGKDTRSDN